MNDDFISSSMDTGMRMPPEEGGTEGGTMGGVGGGGEGGKLPSVGSMRWARNLSRSALQVTGREAIGPLPSRNEAILPRSRARQRRARSDRESFAKSNCVSHYTCDTRFRDFRPPCARGHIGSAARSYIHVQNKGRWA